MDEILKGLVGLSCLFLAALGTKTMFFPRSMLEILAIEPDGQAGFNSIRGFLGGLFIGSSILLTIGLVTGNTTFFVAVATVMGVVVIGRLLGIVVDGYSKKVLFPLVAEIVMVVIFITAYKQLSLV